MKQYLALMQDILDNGVVKKDRTGVGTLSVFGRQVRFDLKEGFPLVTTKKVHLKSIIHELLWFLNGDTNVKYLQENGVRIWNEWANEEGDLGPVYGHQWREWRDCKVVECHDVRRTQQLMHRGYKYIGNMKEDGTTYLVYEKAHDQISKVIQQLREDPDSRRIIVSAWNVGDLDDMALNPCHNYFQFYTTEMTLLERLDWYEVNEPEKFANAPLINHEDIDSEERLHEILDREGIPRRKLSCFYMMRSNDYLLGAPFNVASYALLTHMIAQQLNMVPDELVYSGVDVHLYSNHLEQAKLQLTREPYPLPKLVIKRKPDSIFDYKYEDFELVNYQAHPHIAAPVAV
ncbi:thymidylate synthase [Escherichia coli]|uniref:thymidylate synthase n=1 Tax=Escherichia coli TaxID=562 RepID=UPI0027395333|nr:thymidylate synthase [Escherichia coli]MDP4360070.1 thymidylate synthase [Escherichia coli]